MKLKIVKNGNDFVILRKHWLTGWHVLTAKTDWRWAIRSTRGWEFFHHKFDNIQDAESFVEKRLKNGRSAWVAFRPDTAVVVKEYK